MSGGRSIAVNGADYRILRLLGKGKGGCSYLAEGPLGQVVVKQIHHEKCGYYQFGDKLAAELGASSTDFPGTMEMTIKEDGSCTFKLDVTDEEFSMSMSGASTATDSTVKGKITVKDVCDVTFQGSAKVAPTENAPVTAPPAGETVIDLAGTPMPIAG